MMSRVLIQCASSRKGEPANIKDLYTYPLIYVSPSSTLQERHVEPLLLSMCARKWVSESWIADGASCRTLVGIWER